MAITAADDEAIERAATVLRAGGLVAFPTETVYGLGADATNGEAVGRIFEAKGRPRFNPLIVHMPDAGSARDVADFSGPAELLAGRFWPGPLTLVLPLKRNGRHRLSDLVTAGLETVAVRVPSHPVAQRLLMACGVPVAAPSANTSGRLSATSAEHVHQDFESGVDIILDGGKPETGLESTIVALIQAPTLLRPGSLSRADVEAALGCPLDNYGGTGIAAPGQLASHYAPRAALRLDADEAKAGELLLAFGPGAPAGAPNLSPSGNLREAAANLFAFLRALDAQGPKRIAVMPVPETGLGEAINDRLRRAAAPRPPA
jgi:L-threonylcarbamoyladenylate synthase